ncbi:MAG: FHA domain-containing protein [Sandaracinaceae bacterium]
MSDDETRTVDVPAEAPRARPAVRGVVVVHGAGEVPRAFPVRRAIVVGRGVDADLVLDDDGASRRHCEIAPTRGALEVRDLASRNGTFVDGRRVEGTALLPFGGVLRIGRTLLVAVPDATAARGPRPPDCGMIGGAALDPVRREIQAIAPLETPVLVEGETGTGKELAAAALHAASGRPGELVPVNCAALPSEIVESELFGHARGAFSGADHARAGLLARAHEGTLFLDEVGSCRPPREAKLLRVLEDGVVRAVADRVAPSTSAWSPRRIATSRGRSRRGFRLDLLHRIAVSGSASCAARAARGHPALVRHLTTLPVADDALPALLAHAWPGNVRELRMLHTAAARARRG